jgi:hypothetical protein
MLNKKTKIKEMESHEETNSYLRKIKALFFTYTKIDLKMRIKKKTQVMKFDNLIKIDYGRKIDADMQSI